MRSKINLLKNVQTPQALKEKSKRTITLVTLISLGAFVTLFISFLLLNLYLAAKVKTVNQKIKLNEVKISALSETEAVQWMISERLSLLGGVLAQDRKFDERLKKIEEVLPSEVSLSQVTLAESTFSLSVTSSRLSSLNQLIENLVLLELGGKHFTKIVLEGLGINEKAIYSLSLSGELL